MFTFFKLRLKSFNSFNFSKMSTKTKKPKKTLDYNEKSKYFNDLTEEEDMKTEKRKSNKTIINSNEKKEEKPLNWEILLENIKKMRSEKTAVVDIKGCEKTFDENESNPKTKRFQVLISLMLSSQTRDEITHKTMQSLIEYGLTVDHIIDTKDNDLKELIRSVSFFNNKVKYIKKTALILRDQYDGDIPDNVDQLIKLPGVGPKMAHLAMLIGWGQCTGIAVDTHVHRICNRLEWVQTKSPEITQKRLENWLPKEHWNDINLLLVGFGQTICSGIRPKCNECLNQKICPFALKNAKNIDF